MTDNNTEDETKIAPMEDDEGGAPIYTEDGELVALHFASFQELSIPDEDQDSE